MSISVDTKRALAALRKFGEIGRTAIRGATNTAAIRVQTYAKQGCPVDLNRLRSSLAITFEASGMAATVGTKVVYAKAVEFGSSARTIRPKSPGGTLRWIGPDGRPRFAKFVNIPARPGRPFLYPAWDRVKPTYLADLRAALADAAAKAASA